MNIDQLIDEMEVYIDNCKTTGMLSGGSMIKVNREELLAMLDELRAQLPRELAESRQIIETRESSSQMPERRRSGSCRMPQRGRRYDRR